MGREKINELGNKYGSLTVIAANKSINSVVMWQCVCICGTETKVSANALRTGSTRSCGCGRRSDISGQRFGKLLALRISSVVSGNAHWLCACDCGNKVSIRVVSLTRGVTKSCGCLRFREGADNPSYICGGTDTASTKSFYKTIRKRDKYTCQDCDKTQEQELKEINHSLSVHHINCDHSDNRDENATTLCVKCHRKVHAELKKIQAEKDYWDMMYRINNGTTDG